MLLKAWADTLHHVRNWTQSNAFFSTADESRAFLQINKTRRHEAFYVKSQDATSEESMEVV